MGHVIDTAASGRAKCRGCQQKIEKDALRFGEAVPNAFGSGEALHWYHLRCGAERRSEAFLPTLEVATQEIPEREELAALARIGTEHPRWCRLARVERASSGRARCQYCRELIPKDALRIALERNEEGMVNASGFVHVRCAAGYGGTATGIFDRLKRSSPDVDADWDEIAADLERGPSSGGGSATPSEAPSTDDASTDEPPNDGASTDD